MQELSKDERNYEPIVETKSVRKKKKKWPTNDFHLLSRLNWEKEANTIPISRKESMELLKTDYHTMSSLCKDHMRASLNQIDYSGKMSS
jgi:hypothetical protein